MAKKTRPTAPTPINVTLQNRLTAKTEGHKEYIRAIVENDYIMVKGPAGSSKSYTAVGMACQYLANKDIDKIYLTRPMIQTGRSGIGFLSGNLDEKFSPFLTPLYEHFEHFLGFSQFNHFRHNNIIRVVPLELLRGKNFENSFIIGDEFQNADYSQIKMILTRVCEGSKIILNGDAKQNDLSKGKECDFDVAFDRLKGLHGLATVELTNADIMRSGMTAKILQRLEI